MTETHLRGGGGGVISHFVHSLTALLGVLQGEARRLAEPAVMHDGAWWGGVGWREGGLQLLVTSVASDASSAPTLSQRDYD